MLALASLVLALAGTLPQAATPAAPSRETAAAVDRYLSRLEAFGFAGVVLVAKGEAVLLSKGYGLADRAKGTRVTPDTIYSIGSITKPFTAAAILKLEAQGKLSVSDPITKHFRDVPPDKTGITLHHLLTHTAGLRSDFAETDYDPVGRDEYCRRALESQLLAPPGTRYEYSNAGYSLLGAIVEQISGLSYEAFLRKELFEPVGMLRTGYLLPKYEVGELARGYRDGEEWGTILERPMAPDGPYWALRANGGIHTSGADMFRWHRALSGDAILPAEARRRMFTPHVAEDPHGTSHYGYGWAISETPRKTKVVAHNGGNGIFFADFLRFVDEDAMIYLASSADISAIDASGPVARLLFGEPVVEPPEVHPLESAALAAFAGEYRLPSGGSIAVAVAGNALRLETKDLGAFASVSGYGEGSAAPGGDLVARVEAMVRKGAAGDFSAVHAAFGGRMPIADVEREEGAAWKRWRDRFGEFRGVKAVARAAVRGPALRTLARLEFDRGERFVTMVWVEGVLEDVEILDGLPATTLLPESGAGFAAFDARRQQVWRVRFGADASGAIRDLVLPAAKGETVASRVR